MGEHETPIDLDGEQGHELGIAVLPEVFVAGQKGLPGSRRAGLS